jgi:hypothetical protein
MSVELQLDGLDRFLSSIHGQEMHLASMIDALGFEPAQARTLREECLPAVAEQFVEAVRRKLTSGDKDLWFRLLNRRFGLDGEPAISIAEAAVLLSVDPLSASQVETDALHKCRSKTTLRELEKELHRIALSELSKSGDRPPRDQIAGKLNRLADLRAAVDLARMNYEARRSEVLKKVQAELDALEAEYQPLLEAAQDNAASLETEIKNDVLLSGQSVMTDVYQAVYVKGRVTWDNDGISNYARMHPEVLKFRREGQPSVTLRTAGRSSAA